MKRLTHLIGTVLFLGSVLFVTLYLRDHWTNSIDFSMTSVLISGALYALTHLTTTFGWLQIVGATGSHIPIREGFVIGLVSQAAKYIPGNVAHHVGRASLAKQVGVPLKTSTLIIAIEIICVCFAALLVGGYMVSEWIPAICVVTLLCLLLTQHRRFVLPILFFSVGLFLAGISFAILLAEPRAIPAYPLAWLVGFLLPGAPAGMGIREAALLAFLNHSISPETLASAVIVHRLITAVVDICVAGAAYFVAFASIQRRAPKN